MRSHHTVRPFHFLRATSLSTGILTLAAGAHIAGGGVLPSPGVLLAILALTALVSTTATRLRLTLPAMTTVLGAGQFALHHAFTMFSGPGLAGSPASAGVHHLSGTAEPFMNATTVHAHAVDSTAGTLMVAGHVLATAVCALLLAKGEAALWALAAWLRPLVQLPEAVTPAAGSSPPALGPLPVLPLRPWRNLRQHSRRGPPSAVVLS